MLYASLFTILLALTVNVSALKFKRSINTYVSNMLMESNKMYRSVLFDEIPLPDLHLSKNMTTDMLMNSLRNMASLTRGGDCAIWSTDDISKYEGNVSITLKDMQMHSLYVSVIQQPATFVVRGIHLDMDFTITTNSTSIIYTMKSIKLTTHNPKAIMLSFDEEYNGRLLPQDTIQEIVDLYNAVIHPSQVDHSKFFNQEIFLNHIFGSV